MSWRKMETNDDVHGYYGNSDWLSGQNTRYVNRTSLFDSELPCGNASLLLKDVMENNTGIYQCEVFTANRFGSGQIELVPVPAEPTTAPVPAGHTQPDDLKQRH